MKTSQTSFSKSFGFVNILNYFHCWKYFVNFARIETKYKLFTLHSKELPFGAVFFSASHFKLTENCAQRFFLLLLLSRGNSLGIKCKEEEEEKKSEEVTKEKKKERNKKKLSVNC